MAGCYQPLLLTLFFLNLFSTEGRKIKNTVPEKRRKNGDIPNPAGRNPKIIATAAVISAKGIWVRM